MDASESPPDNSPVPSQQNKRKRNGAAQQLHTPKAKSGKEGNGEGGEGGMKMPVPSKRQHGIKNKSTKKLSVSADRPRNKMQREAAKNAPTPSILGYLNFPRGPKTKSSKSVPSTLETIPETAQLLTMTASSTKVHPKKGRGTYKDYSKGNDKKVLDCAMGSMLLSGGDVGKALAHLATEYPSGVLSRGTLRSRYLSLTKRIAESGDKHEDEITDDIAMFDRIKNSQSDGKGGGLTSKSTQDYLQSVARSRDNSNRGMSRKEMISFIAQIENVSNKKASNHYEYLVRAKKLSDLKRGGRVVHAQPTTTNRTAITTQKLLRTNNTLELGKSHTIQACK